jgi:hypothetical protein
MMLSRFETYPSNRLLIVCIIAATILTFQRRNLRRWKRRCKPFYIWLAMA